MCNYESICEYKNTSVKYLQLICFTLIMDICFLSFFIYCHIFRLSACLLCVCLSSF